MRRDPKLHKDPKTGIWNLVFYDSDTRRRVWMSLGTRDTRRAEKLKAERTLQWDRGEIDPFDRERRTVRSYTFAEAVAAYLAYKQKDGTPAAVKDAQRYGNLLLRLIGGAKNVRDLTAKDFDRVHFREKLARATRIGYFSRSRALLNWLYKGGILPRDLAADLRRPSRAERVPVFLSRSDASEIMALADERVPWMGVVIRMALGTGMRLSELLRMRWQDVDQEAGFIYVRGKGGHERYVPILPLVRMTLERLNPLTDRVLYDASGQPPDLFVTSRWFKRFVRKLELNEAYHFHSLRHTYASWLVQAGVPIYDVSKWLGHTTVTTTEIYAHLAPRASSEVAAKVLS